MQTKFTSPFSKRFIIGLTALFISTGIYAQLSVNTTLTPQQLVQNVLVGTGVTVSNVTYTGSANSIGKFTTGSSPTNLGISSGIIMSTGFVNGTPAIGSAPSNFSSNQTLQTGGSDPQLQNLIPATSAIHDAAVLEFNFVPISDTIKFRYIFASEEYPEWVCSDFTDVFGFFVTGQNPLSPINYNNFNIARIPNTNLPVAINSLNSGSVGTSGNIGQCISLAYSQYYTNNMSGASIVFDGFTHILTAWCLVIPCFTYHLKLAIGDAGDWSYDSGVFLEANSFSSPVVTLNTSYSSPGVSTSNAVEGCNNAIIHFSLPSVQTSDYPISFAIQGTAINGVDYDTIQNYVIIPAGSNTADLVISPIIDGIPEPLETVTLIVYTSVCQSTTDTITVNILNTDPLSAGASNDTSIICGGTASLSVTPIGGVTPYTYLWDNGLGASPNVSVSPVVTTTYHVTVSDLCGSSVMDSVVVNVSPIIVDAGPDAEICSGFSTNLSVTGGPVFHWSTGETTSSITVSPVTTTTYYVTVSAACDSYDSVTVFVNPLPNITATSTPPSMPNGSSSQICAQGGNTYTWTCNPPDPSLSGQFNNPCATVTPTVTTTYRVVGIDTNGCQNTITTIVEVIPVPPIVNFSGAPIKGCVPLAVSFTDSSTAIFPTSTYYWDFGNGTFSYEKNPVAYYDQNGSYNVTLTITNPDGGVGTLQLLNYITAYQNPVAMFSTNPQNITNILNPVFQFFDLSLGNPNSWYWSFGDGLFDTLQNTIHNYSNGDSYYQYPMMEDTGSFLVTLIVSTEQGCSDTAYKTLRIEPTYSMIVSNAFTPNGDERNQNFCISDFGVLKENYSIVIFNRWGQKVFYSNDIDKCWDGKVNNADPVTGTYVYRINYMDTQRILHELKGTVTIVK